MMLLRTTNRAAVGLIRSLARLTLGLARVHDAFLAGVAVGLRLPGTALDGDVLAELRALLDEAEPAREDLN
jgi:hypothetical protein